MERWRLRSLLVLSASAVYLYGFPSATITFGILFCSRCGRHSTDRFAASAPIPIAASGCSARPRWLDLPGFGRSVGRCVDFIGTLNRLNLGCTRTSPFV